MKWSLLFLTSVAFGACAPSLEFSETAGDGILSFDREPPAGVEVFERPQWTDGDRFVYQRGAMIRLPLRVGARPDGGYALIHEANGVRTLLDEQLGSQGVQVPGQPAAEQRSDPVDTWLHWPLWVGKQWSCHYIRKQAGGGELPLVVTYECDAMEVVKVPAGEFPCLRIWRRARVANEEKYLERVALLWYSPDVGYFARRLENSTEVELEEYHRQ